MMGYKETTSPLAKNFKNAFIERRCLYPTKGFHLKIQILQSDVEKLCHLYGDTWMQRTFEEKLLNDLENII